MDGPQSLFILPCQGGELPGPQLPLDLGQVLPGVGAGGLRGDHGNGGHLAGVGVRVLPAQRGVVVPLNTLGYF